MKQYANAVKKRMIARYPAHLLGGKLAGGTPGEGERGYAHIFQRLEDNFPDGQYPATKRLKGTILDEPIPYYHAEHLTSPQTMCISYFKKFFQRPEYECYLTAILEKMEVILDDGEICDAGFAHQPDPREGNVFDCYFRLTNGQRLFWIARFTEPSFGLLPKLRDGAERYVRNWEEVYSPMLEQCRYYDMPDVVCEEYCCLDTGGLGDCAMGDRCPIHEFYQYYQIWRSILYARRWGDCVLFLSPMENQMLEGERAYIREYARRWHTRNIRSLYWEQLISVTLQTVREEPELMDYYKAWRMKYFP